MDKAVLSRFYKVLALVACVIMTGTIGFALIEGWPLFDCFYMTVITLSTVGYSETHDLTLTGRLFTSGLILFSMLAIAAATANFTSIIVHGDISGTFRRKKEQKMISRLKNHAVVCGGGTIGQTITDQLLRSGMNVVRILKNPLEIELSRRVFPDVPIVEGDQTDETCLADAGIFKASTVVAATPSDYDNLLITITAKSIGTSIKIYATAENADVAGRILKVGANEVICPQLLGGMKIAGLVATQSASEKETSAPMQTVS